MRILWRLPQHRSLLDEESHVQQYLDLWRCCVHIHYRLYQRCILTIIGERRREDRMDAVVFVLTPFYTFNGMGGTIECTNSSRCRSGISITNSQFITITNFNLSHGEVYMAQNTGVEISHMTITNTLQAVSASEPYTITDCNILHSTRAISMPCTRPNVVIYRNRYASIVEW